MRCPLWSAFGAANEVPSDEALTAIFDRFILRIRSDNLDAYHFQVVRLLKLFAASAYLDGRAQPDASDLFVLKHVWNSEDQPSLMLSAV